jgi:pimeloyl-ACP methyl ester carboxylesterase
MDACGIKSAHLVGESLGGWVAAWLASEQPQRVKSLQLLCSGGTKANPAVMDRIKTSTSDGRSRQQCQRRTRRYAPLYLSHTRVRQ